MKNVINAIIFISVLLIVLGIAGNIESHYKITAEVVKVENGSVFYEDVTGNIWEEKTDGYEVGDMVKIKFYNNHTDSTREDDVIEKVKKL